MTHEIKKYKVNSIFGPTIQGEGSHSGLPVCFIRFSGCNRWSGLEKHKKDSICHFCDTNFYDGEFLTSAEILSRLDKISNGIKTVVISGGEPTLQIDEELISVLRIGYQVHLETNGSKDLGNLFFRFDHVSMSPKQKINDTKLKQSHDIKILFPYISEGIAIEDFLKYPTNNIFIQPVEDENYEKNVAGAIQEAKILSAKHGVDIKLSLQIHKWLKEV